MIPLMWSGWRRSVGRGGTAGSRSHLGGLTELLVALTEPQVLLLTGNSGGLARELVALAPAMLAASGRRFVLGRGRTGCPCTGMAVLAATVLAWGVLGGFRVRGRTGGLVLAPGSRVRNRRGRLGPGARVGARR